MRVIEWIIRILGGVPNREFNLLTVEYNNQRDLVNLYRAREDRLQEEIKNEREERKQLQEIIFKNYGVTHTEESPEVSESFQPIKTSPRRWSGLKSALEQDDRNRVKGYSDAKVS